MRYYVFASGSKGNATLITSKDKAIMIDDGITKKKLTTKLAEVGCSLDNISCLLVTHSHSDHIGGIKGTFSPTNIYCTKSTYEVPMQNHLVPYQTYELAGFKITVVPTSHDAVGSIGFIIEDEEDKMVYITDTGYIYDRVCDMIKGADYYIFESNHNVRMEIKLPRPKYLIDRIVGDYGHLSNIDAASYLADAVTLRTKEIVLAHLSEEANTPELALKEFGKVFDDKKVKYSHINVRCASQNDTLCGGKLTLEVL